MSSNGRKIFPTWVKKSLNLVSSDELEDLLSHHELVIDTSENQIFFFSVPIKLTRQEILFLYHILLHNTRNKKNKNKNSDNDGYISATKLMKIIGSNKDALPERKNYKRNALLVKNHIKFKIRKQIGIFLPSPADVCWIPIDTEYYKNTDNMQRANFELMFDLLVKVKSSNYFTHFVRA